MGVRGIREKKKRQRDQLKIFLLNLVLPKAVPPATEPLASRGCGTLSVYRREVLAVSHRVRHIADPTARRPQA